MFSGLLENTYDIRDFRDQIRPPGFKTANPQSFDASGPFPSELSHMKRNPGTARKPYGTDDRETEDRETEDREGTGPRGKPDGSATGGLIFQRSRAGSRPLRAGARSRGRPLRDRRELKRDRGLSPGAWKNLSNTNPGRFKRLAGTGILKPAGTKQTGVNVFNRTCCLECLESRTCLPTF
jgi:hypothetical protein